MMLFFDSTSRKKTKKLNNNFWLHFAQTKKITYCTHSFQDTFAARITKKKPATTTRECRRRKRRRKKIYDGNCHTAESATNQVEITTRNSSNNKPNALEQQQQLPRHTAHRRKKMHKSPRTVTTS